MPKRNQFERDYFKGWSAKQFAEFLKENGKDFFVKNALEYFDFSGADCSNIDFSGSLLTCANFTKANLTGANLRETHLAAASICDANLQNVKNATIWQLDKAEYNRNTKFPQYIKDIMETTFPKDYFKGWNAKQFSDFFNEYGQKFFQNKDLTGFDFSGANCDRVKFSGSNLSNANFKNARLERADFNGANLTGANMEHVIPSIWVVHQDMLDGKCSKEDYDKLVKVENMAEKPEWRIERLKQGCYYRCDCSVMKDTKPRKVIIGTDTFYATDAIISVVPVGHGLGDKEMVRKFSVMDNDGNAISMEFQNRTGDLVLQGKTIGSYDKPENITDINELRYMFNKNKKASSFLDKFFIVTSEEKSVYKSYVEQRIAREEAEKLANKAARQEERKQRKEERKEAKKEASEKAAAERAALKAKKTMEKAIEKKFLGR